MKARRNVFSERFAAASDKRVREAEGEDDGDNEAF